MLLSQLTICFLEVLRHRRFIHLRLPIIISLMYAPVLILYPFYLYNTTIQWERLSLNGLLLIFRFANLCFAEMSHYCFFVISASTTSSLFHHLCPCHCRHPSIMSGAVPPAAVCLTTHFSRKASGHSIIFSWSGFDICCCKKICHLFCILQSETSKSSSAFQVCFCSFIVASINVSRLLFQCILQHGIPWSTLLYRFAFLILCFKAVAASFTHAAVGIGIE